MWIWRLKWSIRNLFTLESQICGACCVDTVAKWVRMLRRFVIRVWIDYECSTSIAKFTPVTTIFFLLNKICDGGSSKEPFLKAATLSILIWAYPRGTKTNNGNFKNAAILRSKTAYRWRACALILPLCPLCRENLIKSHACAFDQKILTGSFNGNGLFSKEPLIRISWNLTKQ